MVKRSTIRAALAASNKPIELVHSFNVQRPDCRLVADEPDGGWDVGQDIVEAMSNSLIFYRYAKPNIRITVIETKPISRQTATNVSGSLGENLVMKPRRLPDNCPKLFKLATGNWVILKNIRHTGNKNSDDLVILPSPRIPLE